MHMDGELERYHKTNSGLDLLISNLKLKQTGLQGEVGAVAWLLPVSVRASLCVYLGAG